MYDKYSIIIFDILEKTLILFYVIHIKLHIKILKSRIWNLNDRINQLDILK